MAKNANVENNEVLQLPGQSTGTQMNGATHENGGINVNVPQGTQVYSDRLKLGGQTIADRKAARDKRLAQITTAFNKDKSNIFIKNSLNRVSEANQFQDDKDLAFQEAAKKMIQGAADDAVQQFAFGTSGTGNYWNNLWDATDPTKVDPSTIIGANKKSTDMGFTTGDIVGTVGTAVGSISQMLNTFADAKATKPVINRYAGFNEKAIANNQLAKDTLGYNEAQAKTELERTLQVGENTARARTRGSATDIGTLRALDLSVDTNAGEAKAKGTADINNSFNQQLMTLFGVDTQLLSEKDKMVMSGAEKADEANAANLDSFYSNFAKNIAGATENIQSLGKNINEAKSRNMFLKILPETNAWGYGFNTDGTMSAPSNNVSNKYKPNIPAIKDISTGFNIFDPNTYNAMYGKLGV